MREVTIQIASIPSRIHLLNKTIDSLYGQAETINVFLNGYDFVPTFLNKSSINVQKLDNSTGASAKFHGVEKIKEYIFTCDDDIIYPSHYVRSTLKRLKEYNDKCIVTYHGKVFKKKPIQDYYKDEQTKYHFLKRLMQDKKVDIGGTGVMAFHSSALKIKYKDFYSRNMSDIHLSRVAKKQNVDIVCLNHLSNFFKYMSPQTSIYRDYFDNCKEQTNEVNKFL